MPQLPSGRHVGLGLDPLNSLVARIKESAFITEVLVIEEREHLYRYVDLLILQVDSSLPTPEYARGSLPVSADLKTNPSGYTLATMAPEVETWPISDQQALLDFVYSARTEHFLDNTLQWVKDIKRSLLDDPRFAVRVQAAMWLGGAHPLQTEGKEGEDP